MNRRELETLFLTLESTPALLARAAAELPEDRVRHRGTAGGFSLVEQVWHLADLEREAYAVRIRRLLAEDEPLLSNFDGDRVAKERLYQRRDLAEGLAAEKHPGSADHLQRDEPAHGHDRQDARRGEALFDEEVERGDSGIEQAVESLSGSRPETSP